RSLSCKIWNIDIIGFLSSEWHYTSRIVSGSLVFYPISDRIKWRIPVFTDMHKSIEFKANLSFNPFFVFTPILFYFVSLAIYRIFFHPLAKFPGPFLAKVTPLFHTYLAIRGDRHLFFEKYHKKYGDIFRMGPNELSIADASSIKEIYGHGKRLLKPVFYDAMNTPSHQHSIFSERDIAKNSRKRRIISSVMAAKNMVQMEWVMIEKTDLFCDKVMREIKDQGGSKVYDISNSLDCLTFDIMGVLW
ncbi:Benzoate 4-monooxygenase, partial [Neolecta irregularis DAH-3]